jgi:hypothetical protein
MKKTIFITFAVLILLFANTFSGYAARSGSYHGGGSYHGSGHYRGGGYYHGPRFSYSGNIWIGPGWGPWWGPGWGYPYYYSYPYYPYYQPPVINQQQSPVYVEPAPQQEEQNYWYYCPNPQGYYPYVQQCPKGWLKVIPSTVPPDEGE